ncbi:MULTISPECIES: hypothetical protein [unclassified Mycobacterium]|uniref:hypothetical protein n=1 Tax=unclassified Mycobacterium TaxID=2642494 RepID=UPI0012E85FEB
MTAGAAGTAGTTNGRIQVVLADRLGPRNLTNAGSSLLRPGSGIAMDTFIHQHRLRSSQHAVYSAVGCDFRLRVAGGLDSLYFGQFRRFWFLRGEYSINFLVSLSCYLRQP